MWKGILLGWAAGRETSLQLSTGLCGGAARCGPVQLVCSGVRWCACCAGRRRPAAAQGGEIVADDMLCRAHASVCFDFPCLLLPAIVGLPISAVKASLYVRWCACFACRHQPAQRPSR